MYTWENRHGKSSNMYYSIFFILLLFMTSDFKNNVPEITLNCFKILIIRLKVLFNGLHFIHTMAVNFSQFIDSPYSSLFYFPL